MIRSLIWAFILLVMLALGACTKEKNSSTLAYDSIPTVINTSEKFSYKFRMGYLTLDTLIPLAFDHDSMSIHLKISDYKSGYAISLLQGADTTFLSLEPLQANRDTLIHLINSDTTRKWGLLTYKFTGNFSVEILPWK